MQGVIERMEMSKMMKMSREDVVDASIELAFDLRVFLYVASIVEVGALSETFYPKIIDLSHR